MLKYSSHEELVKEARKRFLPGTKCCNDNLGFGCTFTITGTDYRESSGTGLLVVSFNSTECGGNYTVYTGEKGWCDIIEVPFESQLNRVREIIKEE